MRAGLAPVAPLNPHSLQVGSHLPPLQHRNSFCVSALSHQPSLYSTSQGYSSMSTCAAAAATATAATAATAAAAASDPFTFTHPHRMNCDELASEVCR